MTMPLMDDNKLKLLKEQYIAVAKDINTPIDIQMLEVLTKNLGQNIPRSELERMLNEIDEDGNGTMEFQEFVAVMAKKNKESELEMRDAFGVLDRGENGYVSSKDLRHVFLCMGENYSLEEIEEMLKEVDDDGDGNINFQEFLKLMEGE